MKRLIAAVALLSAVPAFAAPYEIDFEKTWDFSNSGVNSYYAGGQAADGSTGPDFGATFSNVFGLSNETPFTYYLNAPSMVGTAYVSLADVGDRAFMNVGSGVRNTLSFAYSSPVADAAISAFSGVNGTGVLLGTFILSLNDNGGFATETGNYGSWTRATFAYEGLARSFDLTGLAGSAGIDDIRYDTTIPVPAAFPMMVLGLGALGAVARRRRAAAATAAAA